MIYDPDAPDYADEYAVRNETTRVFDHCLSCRLCESVCETFTLFFGIMGRKAAPDAGLLTPAEQDRVLMSCISCGLCLAPCPYSPARVSESSGALDFPELVVRHRAMLRRNGLLPWRSRLAEYWSRLNGQM